MIAGATLRRPQPGGRAADRLHRGARAPRVREPVERRLHGHVDQPAARRRRRLSCRRTPFTGGVDYDWRLGRRCQHLRLLGGEPRAGQHGGDHAAAGEQRACVPASRRRLRRASTDRHHACRATPARSSFGKICGREDALQRATSATRRPASTCNDLGFQRRADETIDQQLVPVARQRAGPVHALLRSSTSTSGRGGTSAAIGPSRGGNVNMHWTWKNYYSSGFGVNFNARAVARSRHARRARRARQPAIAASGSTRHRQPQGAVVQLQRLSRSRRPRHDRATTSVPGVNWRPTSAMSVSGGLPLQHQQRRCAVGGERGRRGRRHALRVRADRPAHVGVHLARQLHADAEPVDSDLRRAVRVGRRVHELPRAGRRPRAPSTAIATGRTPTPSNPDFNYPLVPHHQRAALGIQAGLVALRRVAAGPVRRRRRTATSTSAATSAASSRRRRTTCSW